MIKATSPGMLTEIWYRGQIKERYKHECGNFQGTRIHMHKMNDLAETQRMTDNIIETKCFQCF